VWFLLGYAFFSAMAAASRALVSRQEEINGVMMPVTLLTMTAYVVGLLVVRAVSSSGVGVGVMGASGFSVGKGVSLAGLRGWQAA
jgi:ABC-2 type transport system permease protein